MVEHNNKVQTPHPISFKRISGGLYNTVGDVKRWQDKFRKRHPPHYRTTFLGAVRATQVGVGKLYTASPQLGETFNYITAGHSFSATEEAFELADGQDNISYHLHCMSLKTILSVILHRSLEAGRKWFVWMELHDPLLFLLKNFRVHFRWTSGKLEDVESKTKFPNLLSGILTGNHIGWAFTYHSVGEFIHETIYCVVVGGQTLFLFCRSY